MSKHTNRAIRELRQLKVSKTLATQTLSKLPADRKSVRYQIASGEIKEGTEIILREIEVDGYIIKDVSATIVFEQNAPLLLGLSALNKLGKVELQNGILKIYPKADIINNEKKQILRNLHESGIPEDMIADQLDLDLNTVMSLVQEINR